MTSRSDWTKARDPTRSYFAQLTMRGDFGSSTVTSAADADGRLHVEVPLGPPNPYQQDTAEAMAAGTVVYTTSVAIAKVR